MIDKEAKHRRIEAELNELEILAPKVVASFFIFWLLWFAAVVGAIGYYFF